MEQTLSIIKPDAVGASEIGAIIEKFESQGLNVVAAKMIRLSKDQGKQFYGIHSDKPFFNDLVGFISSGPVLVMVLEGPDAIAENRRIMGATNPEQAEPGTIRAEFAKSIDENAVHGSDSKETAKSEIAFFFKTEEIFPRA